MKIKICVKHNPGSKNKCQQFCVAHPDPIQLGATACASSHRFGLPVLPYS